MNVHLNILYVVATLANRRYHKATLGALLKLVCFTTAHSTKTVHKKNQMVTVTYLESNDSIGIASHW